MATQLSAVTMIGTTGRARRTACGSSSSIRFAARDGHSRRHARAVPARRESVHGVRVSRAPVRRKDAIAHRVSVSRVARRCRAERSSRAPAVVFSAIFGWTGGWSVALIGVPAVLYTMVGGVQAVTWVDVKQMISSSARSSRWSSHCSCRFRCRRATRSTSRAPPGGLRVFDFSFTLTNPYTFWSGLIGGTFLMLSYFGTDQSQVQRYLAAKSVDEARTSLLISAYWKIPLQAMVLLVGVLVFVFYQFQRPPLLFNPAQEKAVRDAEPAAYSKLEARYASDLVARENRRARRRRSQRSWR